MTASRWYHTDLSRVSVGDWRGYVVEIEQFVHGINRADVQEEARRIIEETTGDNDPKIVWNEC